MEVKACTHKECPFSGSPQPITHFPKDRSRADGRHPHCRTCRTRLAQHRMAHNPEARERAAAATRRYRETPHGKAREREYYLAHKAEYRRREREYAKRQDVRERMARKQAAYRERNALKECARREVARALRNGSLCIPAMCEWCHKPASDERLEAHHWRGYEAHHWLDVKFVHAACHDVCESIPPDHWM